MMKSTLGLIETYGFIGAVEALDVAVKAANVELVSCEFIKGGIVTILITGEVASVKAAVEASAMAVDKLGVLRNTHVIARADEGVWNILEQREKLDLEEVNNEVEETKETLSKEITELSQVTGICQQGSVQCDKEFDLEENTEILSHNEEEIGDKTESSSDNLMESNENIKIDKDFNSCKSREDLEVLKVPELRTLARELREAEKISLTKKQIKFSKKEQLIEAILKGQ